jgi:mRNA interferase MazF
MLYDAFDVVLVPFPFTDKTTVKKRPAMVLSSARFQHEHQHLTLAMITTAGHSAWACDVPLGNWVAAGLNAPSIFRLKVFTLDSMFIIKKLGCIADSDRPAIQEAFTRYFRQLYQG